MPEQLKIAIIGCGKIADQHVLQILRIKGAKLIAVCDAEELMARQLAERFGIEGRYTDVDQMLSESVPDVVHITTPPQSHLALGMQCLKRNCHVYMEKPFTVNTEEAQKLIQTAVEKNLKITVGHNAQFTHAANRMRILLAEDYLGGHPVHLESHYCYNLGDPRYALSLLGDRNHWVRQLPGQLLHNIISHGISKIAEFIKSDDPTVIAHGFTSNVLREVGETEIVDELRVIIDDELGTTAYFTFSSQLKPTLHQLRLYGNKNGLVVDDDQQTVIKLRGNRYKSYMEQFIPPFFMAGQYISNLKCNAIKFARRDFHADSGMKNLIEAFYASIIGQGLPPISYREIILTSKLMDNIFEQLTADNAFRKIARVRD